MPGFTDKIQKVYGHVAWAILSSSIGGYFCKGERRL